MRLYYHPGACSLSPHIALREAGLPFELVKVDLQSHTYADGKDYLTINPKGYVPALVIENGQILTEGPAVVQYIADQKPEANLAPRPGTFERYRLQEWLNFITSELHKSLGSLLNPLMPGEWQAIVRQNLGRRFDWIDPQLTGRPYLMGEHFTVADGYLFAMLHQTKRFGIDLSNWPALCEFDARIDARPKVKQALAAEGLR